MAKSSNDMAKISDQKQRLLGSDYEWNNDYQYDQDQTQTIKDSKLNGIIPAIIKSEELKIVRHGSSHGYTKPNNRDLKPNGEPPANIKSNKLVKFHGSNHGLTTMDEPVFPKVMLIASLIYSLDDHPVAVSELVTGLRASSNILNFAHHHDFQGMTSLQTVSFHTHTCTK